MESPGKLWKNTKSRVVMIESTHSPSGTEDEQVPFYHACLRPMGFELIN